MRIFQCGYSLKPTLCSLLSQIGHIKGGGVIFRRFNSLTDEIVNKFTKEEWDMIFEGVDEQRLKTWDKIALDRIILVSCDAIDNVSFGFICIQEMKERLGTVLIHGGIWNHNTRHMIQVFKGQNVIIRLLLDRGFTIEATCIISNKKADKMQKSLGFVEYKRDGNLSFKFLDVEKFSNNIVLKRGKREKSSTTYY